MALPIRCWLLAAILANMMTSANCSEIDEAMRRGDSRLDKAVSITNHRIRIGELMERLSDQTGIDITADERDLGSGTQIVIQCRNVPVVKVLNAVWSLVSNRDGRWSWTRSGASGTYQYELSQPLRAKDRVARRREFAKQALVNHALTMIDFARMSPGQRERNKHKITESLGLDDDSWADAFLRTAGVWDVTAMLSAVMSRNILLSLLRGEPEPSIQVSDLPEPARRLVSRVWSHWNLHESSNGGPLESVPQPAELRFYITGAPEDSTEVAPSVMLQTSNNGGAISVMGGYALEEGMRAVIKKLWLLPDDTLASPEAERVVGPGIEEKIPPAPEPIILGGRTWKRTLPRLIESRLIQVAQGADVPIIALLPRRQNGDPGDPVNLTIRDFLQKIKPTWHHLMYKWREGVLLVCHPVWFMEEDHAISYRLVKRHLSRKDRLVPLADMVKLMASITDAQANDLAQDYNAINGALEMRPLFVLAGRFPQLLTLGGLKLTPQMVDELHSLPRLANQLGFADHTATALRLVQIDTENGGRPGIAIRAEVQTGGKEWRSLSGFEQIAPPASAESSKTPG